MQTRRDVAIAWLSGWANHKEATTAFGEPPTEDLSVAWLDERCLVELGEDDFLTARDAFVPLF